MERERSEQDRSNLLKQAIREVFEEYGIEDEKRRKEVLKEAISEWLDAKFAEFGKYTFYGLLAAALAALAILAFVKFGISVKMT